MLRSTSLLPNKHKNYAYLPLACVILSDMKPENNQSPAQGFEQLPVAPSFNPEAIPTLPHPEAGIETGQQRIEQAAEAGARAANAAGAPPMPMPVALPQPPQQTQAPPTAATPLVAADEDLIEKEWVERAKDIIQSTKDDPHARNAQVSELQRGYLEKRFGRVIGSAD